jgi:hypothetical protein
MVELHRAKIHVHEDAAINPPRIAWVRSAT